jgi:ketopantoate reductase
VTTALIIGLSAVALYFGIRLLGARAEITELLLQNARLKRRLERGAR